MTQDPPSACPACERRPCACPPARPGAEILPFRRRAPVAAPVPPDDDGPSAA